MKNKKKSAVSELQSDFALSVTVISSRRDETSFTFRDKCFAVPIT